MTNNQAKRLGELITEALELRKLDVKKLSELTDIPVHYLTALIERNFSKLPPSPYVRGYLLKIAQVLRIDNNILLRAYKQELQVQSLKVSGPKDKLPSNRYAFKKTRKKTIIIWFVLILLIVYLGWQANHFLGNPQIEIISPAADNLIVNTPSIKISGKIKPGDKLMINNEEVLTDKTGYFEKEISLQTNINTIEFKVKRFLGKEIKVIRQVIYQP